MIDHIVRFTVPAAYALLPARMASPNATAMMLAIGLTESKFLERLQLPNGPARSFWQYERASLFGIAGHPASAVHLVAVLDALRYLSSGVDPTSRADLTAVTFAAVQHNDTLACCCARLLLRTLPAALPGPRDVEAGWAQYLEAWRPGAVLRGTKQQQRKRRALWATHYADAWARVEEDES